MASNNEFGNQYHTYGRQKIGFGGKLAVLVVDFQRAFTDSSFQMGGAPLIDRAVKNTERLLMTARQSNIPVASCVMGYGSRKELPHWKVTACHDLIIGNPECEIDSRIHNPDYDLTIIKRGPSIFFQTPLITFLVSNQVDTVIVTGCVTSGCIRASVIDSFQHGFRTIVPEDCVGDHEKSSHKENLKDIERRYADILNADKVIEKILTTATSTDTN